MRRPFARRERNTARPPRVDIRARNPCLRARLRLFGWKVRFTAVSLCGARPCGQTQRLSNRIARPLIRLAKPANLNRPEHVDRDRPEPAKAAIRDRRSRGSPQQAFKPRQTTAADASEQPTFSTGLRAADKACCYRPLTQPFGHDSPQSRPPKVWNRSSGVNREPNSSGVDKVVEIGENGWCQAVIGADQVWSSAADRLREMVADGVWQSTFSQVEAIDLDNDVIILAVPNSIIRDKLEGTYRGLVEDAIDQASEDSLAVQFDLRPPTLFDSLSSDFDAHPPSTGAGSDVTARQPDPAPRAGSADNNAPYRPAPSLDGGNRYTFDGFVIGPSNRFAHAAGLSVAERPGESYNPLFIYGSAGLGKTHLLRAIEHYVNDVYPDLRVLYISTEQFLNEFVDSIRNSSNNDFKRRYRQIDVLLVDDIQFIAGKDGLQEEFFHTFNELYGSGRQIVLSSDRPPDAIPTLEDRLRSRFMMGLLTDIQPPDVETRMAILHKKADRDGYFIPTEVSEFIATNITSNIRELEGALTKVTAYANLNRQPMTRDLAEQTLRDFIADRQPRPITVDMILDSTAEQFHFDLAELIGKSRRRPLVEARQIAMYVTRELTDLSYPLIAAAFGGRDHTTVMHACEKIGKQMTERSQIFEKVGALERTVRARASD